VMASQVCQLRKALSEGMADPAFSLQLATLCCSRELAKAEPQATERGLRRLMMHVGVTVSACAQGLLIVFSGGMALLAKARDRFRLKPATVGAALRTNL